MIERWQRTMVYDLLEKSVQFNDVNLIIPMYKVERLYNEYERYFITLFQLDQLRIANIDTTVIRPWLINFMRDKGFENLHKPELINIIYVIILHQSRYKHDDMHKLINDYIKNNKNDLSIYQKAILLDEMSFVTTGYVIYGTNVSRFKSGYRLRPTINDIELNSRRISFGLPPLNLDPRLFIGNKYSLESRLIKNYGTVSVTNYINN